MYTKSETALSEETVAKMVEHYGIAPWTKRNGEPRYYLNDEELSDLIGLRQNWYKSGNCSGCYYTDERGNEVSVAHSKCYGDGFIHKTYIAGGRVYSTWQPYGANIAELVAMRISEKF